MAAHRISDAAEAALHRVAESEGTTKLGDILSRLIIDYERGLTFEAGQVYGPDGKPMREGAFPLPTKR